MSALDNALALAERGFYVHPVKPRTKEPLLKGWPNLATIDPGTIERWWWDNPHANVGVVPGKGGAVALDVDPRNGGRETLDDLEREHGSDWTRTITTITGGGGEHLYLDAGGRRFRDGDLGPGVEVKVHNYLLAPQSIHPNGTPYEWEPGYSPFESDALPVPEWLSRLLPSEKEATTDRRIRVPDGVVQVMNIHNLHYLLDAQRREDGLRELAACEPVVFALASALGIPTVPVGTAFRCILHPEGKPSAALYRGDNGVYMYRDWHAHGKREEWLTLAEVHYALTTGAARKLNGPEHATWFRRLLVKSGLIEPAPVPMRALLPDASGGVRKVYEGIRLLFGCKWLCAPGAPSPLSWRFLSDWCGVAQVTVDRALKQLVTAQIVKPVGSHAAAYGKTMTLYLPVPP